MSDAPPAKPHDPATSGFWWIPGGLLAATGALIVLWWVWPPNEEVREIGAELLTASTTAPASDPKLDLGTAPPLDLGTGGSADGSPAQVNPLSSYVLETDGGLEQPPGEMAGEVGAEMGETSAGAKPSEADPAASSRPEPGRHHYHRDTSFEWVLRPSHSADHVADLGVRGFAFVEGGSAGLPLSIDPLMQVSESGTIQISGEIGQLGLEPGRYTIALAVGRVEALSVQAQDVLARETDDPQQSWVVRRVELVIAE